MTHLFLKVFVRSSHRWKQNVRHFTRQIRLILASHSFVLTLLKALRRRYGSLMGLVALKRAFTVRSVNPVWLFSNTYPLSSLSSRLSFSLSLCWSDVEVSLPLRHHHHHHHHPSLVCIFSAIPPFIHPSIHPPFVRQSRNVFFCTLSIVLLWTKALLLLEILLAALH